MKYFIAIYTNQVKQYCDQQFFRILGKITENRDCFIHIVDNTSDISENPKYLQRLHDHMEEWLGHKYFGIYKINVNYLPKETLFLRNVTDSINFLRRLFLNLDSQYFMTIESDTIPPINLLNLFIEVENKADIIGGIYYQGFHNPILWNPCVDQLVESKHVLSGCTLYNRKVIEKFEFRYEDNGGIGYQEFPDSCISIDALKEGFKLANYSKIKCLHIEDWNKEGRGRDNL